MRERLLDNQSRNIPKRCLPEVLAGGCVVRGVAVKHRISTFTNVPPPPLYAHANHDTKARAVAKLLSNDRRAENGKTPKAA